MATDTRSDWHPDWSVPPGEILLEALEDRGMTQAELARRTARPLKTINEIVKGKAAITAETAIQLEPVLGISASFWIGLETRHREYLARKQARNQLEANAGWVDGFPIRDLTRQRLIAPSKSKSATLEALLAFFRVSSPDAFERQWLEPAAAFRTSATFMASPKAVAAWLRWGEIEAAKVSNIPEFDAIRFRALLSEIRSLTRRTPFQQVVRQVQEMCRTVGVVVLVMPEFEGVYSSGATRWIGGRPVIQLSLRHKTEDHFWFTFFHEAGHILGSQRGHHFVDPDDVEAASPVAVDEQLANEFARGLLVPRDEYIAFVGAGDFSAAAVREFARRQQVAPGIVVARLQHDKYVTQAQLSELKARVRWAAG